MYYVIEVSIREYLYRKSKGARGGGGGGRSSQEPLPDTGDTQNALP